MNYLHIKAEGALRHTSQRYYEIGNRAQLRYGTVSKKRHPTSRTEVEAAFKALLKTLMML